MGTTNKCEMGMLLSSHVEYSWRGETTSPERQARPSHKPVGFHPLRLLRVRGYIGGLPEGGRSGGIERLPRWAASPADSEEQIHRMTIMRPQELQKNRTSHSRESLGLANHKASWIPLWALQGCSPTNPGSTCTCTNPENSGLRRDCHG